MHATDRSIPDQQDLLLHLPFDIVWKILSQLDQHDILECMAVCRRWWELVPQYSTGLWHSVTISKREHGLAFHKRKARCLGAHVRTAIVAFHRGDAAFRRDVEQLGHLTGGSVSTAVLCYCSSYQLDGFLGGLRILGRHLTRLVVSNHRGSNLDLFDVMAACPRLAYFEFQHPGVLASQHVAAHGVCASLTDLLLDGSASANFRLEPVLPRCPRLRFLALTEHMWLHAAADGLHLLLRQCPELAFATLAGKSGLGPAKARREDAVAQYADDRTGLRELNVELEDRHAALDASLAVAEHLATLTALKLQLCRYTALPCPAAACSRLRRLEFRDVRCSPADLAALVRSCPLLDHVRISQDMAMFTHDLADALASRLHLRHLFLIPAYNDAALRLRPPRTVASALEHLFATLHANRVHLHTLHVLGSGAPVEDTVLTAIAALADGTIHDLGVSTPFCTDHGLHVFARKIRDARNTSRLTCLRLHHVEALLSKHVLAALADLPALQQLVLVLCIQVSGEGLCDVVQRAPRLQSIHVQRCRFVDHADWLHEADARLGSASVFFDDIANSEPDPFIDWLE